MKSLIILFAFLISYNICGAQEYYKLKIHINRISVYGSGFDSDGVISGLLNISSLKNEYKFKLIISNKVFERDLILAIIKNKHKYVNTIALDSTRSCRLMLDFTSDTTIVQSIFVDDYFNMGVIDYSKGKIHYYSNGIKLVCYLKTILPYYFFEGIRGYIICK